MGLECKIAPSMLSADFACLASEAKRMIDLGADYLHLDIMDGHFVPNLTMGPPIVAALRSHSSAFLDCHLMVSNPLQWVDPLASAGASLITFHIEATDDPSRLIDAIHAKGLKAGISVKPATDISVIFPLLDKLDQVLVMTVEPGFGGQKFMYEMLPKVSILRQKYPLLDIQVDGGLSNDNIEAAAAAGANVVVAGTSIFKAADPRVAIEHFRFCVNKVLHG